MTLRFCTAVAAAFALMAAAAHAQAPAAPASVAPAQDDAAAQMAAQAMAETAAQRPAVAPASGNTVVEAAPVGPPPTPRQAWSPIAPAGDVEATLAASGQFSYLLQALKATQLDKTLTKKKGGPVTVFAPTDTAFAKMPPAELQALSTDRERLKRLLSYHLAPAAVTSAEIRAEGGQATVAGPAVAFEANGRRMAVDLAVVLQADVATTNGSIVVIDKVLTPPPVTASAG